jgi:hypothetical protein
MKLFAKILALLIVVIFAQENVMAQGKILAMSVENNPPIGDTTEFGVPIIDSTTLFNAIMNIVLSDTANIYQVHVKLGSSLHGSQHLTITFDYGVDGTFGNTSYTQTDNVIVLNLGSHIGMSNLFAEVQIEKSDHTLEDAVLFSNN